MFIISFLPHVLIVASPPFSVFLFFPAFPSLPRYSHSFPLGSLTVVNSSMVHTAVYITGKYAVVSLCHKNSSVPRLVLAGIGSQSPFFAEGLCNTTISVILPLPHSVLLLASPLQHAHAINHRGRDAFFPYLLAL